MHYTGTVWRPPFEADSALIQATAGCTHHQCKFCTLYEELPFKFRMSPLSEVKSDMQELSRHYPDARRVFFTGANPFALSFEKLEALAALVKEYFPRVSSIGCFARITDFIPKTDEQLQRLRALGYNGITIGTETGDSAALCFMNKGFGPQEILEQCGRLDEAGIAYHFFYLAGICGASRGEEGARITAEIWNQTRPKIIASSMLTVYPSSELYQEVLAGRWTEETETEKLMEVKTLVQALSIPAYFATMGASNCILVQGHLPQDRERMVKSLEHALACTDEQALRCYRKNLRHL